MKTLLKTCAALVLFALVISLSGCSKKDDDVFDPVAQFNKEVTAIDSYLQTNSIPHLKDVSGIRIVPVSLGTKLPVQALSSINVTYKGSIFPSGSVFDESVADASLSQFIPGWQIAMRKIPVGSTATIYIPSYYGYGSQGNAKIPGNSTLKFDVTINSATNSTVYKDRFTSDTTAIRNYLTTKGIAATKDENGIFYINQVEGSGNSPGWFSQVKMQYSFTLLTDDSKPVGTYDRDVADNFPSYVVDYIQGLQVGLLKMKPGGKMRLFVPSGLAFGIENGYNNTGSLIVPANSNLIIDIELIEVK